MKPAMWAILSALMLQAPAHAAAQQYGEDLPATGEAAQVAAAEPEVAEAVVAEPEPKTCKKKKKKGGLGGLLRAARSSGMIAVVSSRAGTGGALVNSTTNTAIDLADAAGHMAPKTETPKC